MTKLWQKMLPFELDPRDLTTRELVGWTGRDSFGSGWISYLIWRATEHGVDGLSKTSLGEKVEPFVAALRQYGKLCEKEYDRRKKLNPLKKYLLPISEDDRKRQRRADSRKWHASNRKPIPGRPCRKKCFEDQKVFNLETARTSHRKGFKDTWRPTRMRYWKSSDDNWKKHRKTQYRPV